MIDTLEEAMRIFAFAPTSKFQLNKSFGSRKPSVFQVTYIPCPIHVETGSEISTEANHDHSPKVFKEVLVGEYVSLVRKYFYVISLFITREHIMISHKALNVQFT